MDISVITPELVSSVVDFSPIIISLLGMAGTVALGFVSWGIRALLKRVGLDKESILAHNLDNGAAKAINLGINYIVEKYGTTDVTRVEVKNDLLRTAIGYLIQSYPDAIKYFQVENRINEFFMTRLIENPDVITHYTPSSLIAPRTSIDPNFSIVNSAQ